MGAEQNGIWRDTTDLMVYGHEGWLELTGSHGHEGKDFEVHFKYGHNLRPDGLTRKEGLKAWLANPDGEVKEINLAVGGAGALFLNLSHHFGGILSSSCSQ